MVLLLFFTPSFVLLALPPLPPITCWCSLVLCQVPLISSNSFREWIAFTSSGNSANSELEIKCEEPPVENLRHLRAACSPAADTHSPRSRALHEWEQSRPSPRAAERWAVLIYKPHSSICSRHQEECQAGIGQNCEPLKKDHIPLLELIPSVSFSIYLVTQQGRKPLALTQTTWVHMGSDTY